MSTRGRLTRTETKAATRGRLLHAAMTIFAKEGFEGSSVKRIADEAGYTTGALYAHFASKEDLFLTLLEERYETKLTDVAELVATPDHQARDDAVAERFANLRSIEGDWDLLATEFWLYAVRHPHVHHKLADRYRVLRTGVATMIETELARRGTQAALPADQLATIVIALGDGLGSLRRIDPDAAPSHLVPDATNAILNTLAIPTRRPRKRPLT
ncbi:MAG: TetR/AcrR family transcriptional regulator [Microthrixaceae bacterium]